MTGPTREQEQQKQEARARAQPAAAPPRASPPPNPASFDAPAQAPAPAHKLSESKAQSTFQVGEEQRVLGRSGERNLQLKFTDVWLGSARSGRFNLETSAGNGLEATIEQDVYRRTYGGTGTLETQVLPVAPIGTKGKIVARDTTTGEVLERPFTWIDIGQDGGGGLWEMIKRLFWKG
jgi:hypothetical protein